MEHRRTCCLCEAMCGLKVEHDGSQVISIKPDPDDVLSRGHICPKATALADLHEDPDRLRQPVRKTAAGFEPIGWDEAFDLAGERFHALQARYGYDAVGFYLGNPNAHNYGSLLLLPFFHRMLRSRNRYSATSVDQLPHMLVARELFGNQLSIPVADIDRTDLLVVMGGNPVVSGGSMMTAPGFRRRVRELQARGGRLVVIDPRRSETAALADQHLAIRPGTDAWLLMAMAKVLVDEHLVDLGPIAEHTDGTDAVMQLVTRCHVDEAARRTGISAEAIRQLARDLARTERAALYTRLGVSTQAFGGLSVWLAHVVNAFAGNIDRDGGMLIADPLVDTKFIAYLLGERGELGRFKSRVSGYPEWTGELPAVAMAEEMETAGAGQVRGLITLAGNPAISVPNGARLSRALSKLDFMVSIDPYITATSRHADLILPPVSHLERDHYGLVFHALAVRNTANWCGPLFPPPRGAREDWAILAQLGRAIASRRGWRGWVDRAALSALESMTPRDVLDIFLRQGAARRGLDLTLEGLATRPGGVDLGPLRPGVSAHIYHASGRIQLAPECFLEDAKRLFSSPPPTGLTLIGRRSLRSNNSWMHNSSRLAKGKNRCVLLIHPDDAAAVGLAEGQDALLSTAVGRLRVPTEVTDTMMPGVVSLPHGYGHRGKGVTQRIAGELAGESVNDILDDSAVDVLTGTAVLNGVPVRVAPAPIA